MFFYSKINNFGDALNGLFWPALFPEIDLTGDTERAFFGIGTLLNDANLQNFKRKRILGSGVGYGALTQLRHYSEEDIVCVRGPLSARKLGIAPSYAISDPAILLPKLDLLKTNSDRLGREGVIFVPHHYTDGLALDWASLCQSAGVQYVSPAQDPVQVIDKIAHARLVIGESMHAAIIADAYRVPWHPVALSSVINDFKWQDYFCSVGMEVQLRHLFAREQALVNTLKSLRTRKRAGGSRTEGPVAQGAAKPSGSGSKTEATRFEKHKRLSEWLIARKLARLVRLRGHLSEEKILTARQEELHERLTATDPRG